MPEEKSLPKPDPELPKPEKDLPLPEKEITAHSTPTKVKNKIKEKNPLWLIIIGGLILAIIIASIFAVFKLKNDMNQSKVQAITSFEECVAAGYPIMESYPEQCAVPGGPSFTKNIKEKETYANPYSTQNWMITQSESSPDMQRVENAYFGYNFEIPNEWIVKITPNGELEIYLNDQEAKTEISDREILESAAYIRLIKSIYNNTIDGFQADLEKISDPEKDDLGLWTDYTYELTKLDGQDAVVEYSNCENCANSTYFIKKNFQNAIVFNPTDSNSNLINDQILSTFKFTDPNEASNVDTSGWNTYSGKEFTIDYPPDFTVEEKAISLDDVYKNGNSVYFNNTGSFGLNILSSINVRKLNIDNALGNGPGFSYITDCLGDFKPDKFKVDGVDAVGGIVGCGISGEEIDLIWFKGDKIYQAGGRGKDYQTLLKMLSTFKFTQ